MKTNLDLTKLSDFELHELAETLQKLDTDFKYNKIGNLWPNLDAYPKQKAFFEAGAKYRERCIMAANRTGKTYTACTEWAYHLTGKYPTNWSGKKFYNPVNFVSCGQTHLTTRDILQEYLIGPRNDIGSGFIPKEDIEDYTAKAGTPNALQDVFIKHITNGIVDGTSKLTFKSYDQGTESIMGLTLHGIHMDEEPSADFYGEAVIRTMTTNGILVCTFTPLLGLSQVAQSFLVAGRFPENGMGEIPSNVKGN